MRKPATVIILILSVILFSCSALLASDFDPLKTVSSSILHISSGLNNGIQRVSTSLSSGYNSWTAQNRAAMPRLAAQYDHYTKNFGLAGAPLFAIGQVTNPVLSYVTGANPGSQGAKDFGRGCNNFWGGIANLPTKVLLGRDLANPEAAPLQGLNRIRAITANEALQYGLFVGMPAIAKGMHVLSFSEKIPWLIRPGTIASAVTWPTLGFTARSLAGPLFGETIGSRDNIANAGFFAAQVLGFSVFNYVAHSLYNYPSYNNMYNNVKALSMFYDKIPKGYFLMPIHEAFLLPIAGAISGMTSLAASGAVDMYRHGEDWRNYVDPVSGYYDADAYIRDSNKRSYKYIGNSFGWPTAVSISRLMVSEYF